MAFITKLFAITLTASSTKTFPSTHFMPIMDPPEYGYEYWKHYHSDCELVHVMWTDYCGILHEKLLPADTFGRMFRKHAYNLSDPDDLFPLTVSAASLTSLPDGKSTAERTHPSYKTCNLIPDYSAIQPCIDTRRRATVFAKVEVGGGPLLDPREILKGVCKGIGPGKEQQIRASLEFQFVLRNPSDGKVNLPRGTDQLKTYCKSWQQPCAPTLTVPMVSLSEAATLPWTGW